MTHLNICNRVDWWRASVNRLSKKATDFGAIRITYTEDGTCLEGQGEIEYRALSGFAFHPYLAIMPVNDAGCYV